MPASAIESATPGQCVRTRRSRSVLELVGQRRYELLHEDVLLERVPDLPVVAWRELEGDLQILACDVQVVKEQRRGNRRDQRIVHVVGKQVVEHDVGTGIRFQRRRGNDSPHLGGYPRIADPLQRTLERPLESRITLVYRPRLLDPYPEPRQPHVQLSLHLQDLLLQSFRFLAPLRDLSPKRRKLPDLVQRTQ